MSVNLEDYGQEHLRRYYNDLSRVQQAKLDKQFDQIDFDLMVDLFKRIGEESVRQGSKDYQPTLSFNLKKSQEHDSYEKIGVDAIRAGKLAVVLMAGGQGSRLGFDGPKGAYDIGLKDGASLFELQAQSLLAVKGTTGVSIKWYVMTSETNHTATIDFFEENGYFGYDPKQVKFFSQGMLPAVNEQGQIILEDKDQIAFSPNGNGGVFLALKDHGIMDEMLADGVEWVFIYGVDNALVKVAAPDFFGYTLASGCPVGSKIVKKREAGEKVGVVCYKDGKPAIVEYSELGQEMSELRDEDGSLSYDNANIVNHLLKLEVIDALLEGEMHYHVAHKFVDGIDVLGDASRRPNAYKFETFIFDIFDYCDDMAVVEVAREEEFAPVKNKDGKDSPATAKALVEASRRLRD